MANALETRGWSVWWDRKIIAGQIFDQAIERELEMAKSVVVLWSKDSITSEWVKNEASHAAERGVLVPAIIDEIRPPLEFRRKQTADLVGWNGDPAHPGFVSLCDGVTANAVPQLSPHAPSALRHEVGRNSRWKWITAAVIIILVVGFAAYWRVMRSTGSPVVDKPAESNGLADSVVGTYYGNVISDSQGASQSDVTVTVVRLSNRKVRVTSDYSRLGSAEVDLTRAGDVVVSATNEIVLAIDLIKRPQTLNYNPGGAAFVGQRR